MTRGLLDNFYDFVSSLNSLRDGFFLRVLFTFPTHTLHLLSTLSSSVAGQVWLSSCTFSFLIISRVPDISLQTLPKELTQSERNSIVSISNRAAIHFFDFYLPVKPTLFIKQGDDVLAEASTLLFFPTRSGLSAPLIPRVFDAFCQEGYCFFIMEKIETSTIRACNIFHRKCCLCRQVASRPDAIGSWFSVWKDFVRKRGLRAARVLQESWGSSTLRQLQRAP